MRMGMTPEETVKALFPHEGTIHEVILTSFRPTKEGRIPNASALGVKRSGINLFSTLFEGSNSFQAIKKGELAGICIPSPSRAPEMFVRAALSGYGDNEREFKNKDYEIVSIEDREVPVLKDCSARIIVETEEVNERMHRDGLGECRVKDVVWRVIDARAAENILPAYSRFMGLLIEALIEGSRYLSTGDASCLERAESHLRNAERLACEEELSLLREVRSRIYSSSSRLE